VSSRRVRGKVADVVGGTEDHERLGQFGDDASSGLDSAHLGHVDVHENDVRVDLIGELESLHTVLGLTCEREALGASYDRARRHSKGRLVVDDHD
jgi:hypothetical protein